MSSSGGRTAWITGTAKIDCSKRNNLRVRAEMDDIKKVELNDLGAVG